MLTTYDFLSHPFYTVLDMKSITLIPIRRAEMPAVVRAVNLLAELGAEIVDRCQAGCEICGPVLDAAA